MKARRQLLDITHFIAELYLQQVVDASSIHACIAALLQEVCCGKHE